MLKYDLELISEWPGPHIRMRDGSGSNRKERRGDVTQLQRS
jgi:hypothetical protein